MRRAYRQEERSLQAELIWRLKSWPIVAIPIPNGFWIPTHNEDERRLVGRLLYQMKNYGMLQPGAPDLSLHWCGGSALVEIKTPASVDMFGKRRPGGQLSEAQRSFAERAEQFGVRTAIVRSWDELHARLVEWRVPAV